MAVLKDIMPRGVTLVFVGEAAGDESAQLGHYYAMGGNSFWDDLYESGLTPIRLAPEQDGDLPRYGIGLTDVVKDLKNSQLKREGHRPEKWRERVAQLRNRIRAARPRIVCLNQLDVGLHVLGYVPSAGRLAKAFAGIETWAVHSSSWRARRYRGRRLEALRQLASRLADLGG